MTKSNVFNIAGIVDKIEEREKNGEKFILFRFRPACCKRYLTLFVHPKYKNGETNKVFESVKMFKEGDPVKITVSPFNSSLFLFGIKKFEPNNTGGLEDGRSNP